MRKAVTTLGLGVAAAVMLTASPAQAGGWNTSISEIKNGHTGKCLSGSGRTVSQETCGLPVSGGVRSTDWDFYDNENSLVKLVRNKATGLCLDTNGTNVYLSGCTTSDPGQLWVVNTCDQVLGSLTYNRDLVGWNTGGVSLESDKTGTDYDKIVWRVSGFPTGCGG
ncbi:ricin-type beta-trefoil lectin domain protein [Streptomyces sp. NPDC006654]|uniref:ricin-type beta-trefoil lectin domain protein n=1 Tax=Streptomyces sp. NPDC006654 TaxID=3156897 RepID=UPI0034003636